MLEFNFLVVIFKHHDDVIWQNHDFTNCQVTSCIHSVINTTLGLSDDFVLFDQHQASNEQNFDSCVAPLSYKSLIYQYVFATMVHGFGNHNLLSYLLSEGSFNAKGVARYTLKYFISHFVTAYSQKISLFWPK